MAIQGVCMGKLEECLNCDKCEGGKKWKKFTKSEIHNHRNGISGEGFMLLNYSQSDKI